ncbi:NACHT domain-containing NTPase [Pseudanabaena sp. FACHB-2040]|uniref:NACHT domain-containing protein n=1 Tax=Pseudanabaena sp. FACHB-2040 TaxID=2692859 RepID=UPI0016856CB1|nr:NACHT domain-containing NTPase [Pseudanabaena sp. FACHB-2040]MBD2260352.1 NACHT domain-containing NTPase [Pseudanabaena sp. FACHB-2040]
MAKPSLAAAAQGLQVAQQTLTRKGWTKAHLADIVGCSRQPVTSFFKGEAVSQVIFMDICDRLGLDWQTIAGLTDTVEPAVSSVSAVSTARQVHDFAAVLPVAHAPLQPALDGLVQTLRQRLYTSIRERCGTMRVLDMSYPIEVNDIYTSVNVLEQISGRRHRPLEDLIKACDSKSFDRLGLGAIAQTRVPALEAVKTYQKLIILGKPGAGKTTFLKHLAIQCNEGQLEPDRLPIFVTLKDFAEVENSPNLLQYISRDLNHYAASGSGTGEDALLDEFYQVFAAGRALILLDGLDEVRSHDHARVIKEIRSFSEQFHHSLFVMTCRIAAWDYIFEKFTEVEVADFDDAQITTFASKWFGHQAIPPERFLRQLNQHPPIKELATNPLLLTLICLAFEASGGFPHSRFELYKEGIDALLRKWDAKRGIQRDQVYKHLSPLRKEDLLSYLALITFQANDYCFKQRLTEQHIADYICNLSDTDEPESLQVDSEVILRSIEAQHGLLIERAKGIYSFSHLTFHEYFVAREIVQNSRSLETALQDLAAHGPEPRWREVILLATEMLRDASLLLLPLKQTLDQLLAGSERLQAFLREVCDRAAAPEFAAFNPAAACAFCFDIDFDIDENRTVALALDRTANLLVCASFLTRMMDQMSLAAAIALAQSYDAQVSDPAAKITAAPTANAVMLIAIDLALDSGSLDTDERHTLKTLLQRLQGQTEDDETVREVADQARAVAKNRHHIGKERQFTPQEKHQLRQYYHTTRLLVDCLNSDGCMLSPKTRRELQASLFTPLPT